MMSSVTVVLSGLTSTSFLLAVAMTIAWTSFGRDRHTLCWAASFYAMFAMHLIGLVRNALGEPRLALDIAALAMMLTSSSLLALGFRRRAGSRGSSAEMVSAIVVLAVSAVMMACLPQLRFYSPAAHMFAAGMLFVSASVLRNSDGEWRGALPATYWGMLAAGTYAGLLGVAALAVRPLGLLSVETFRTLSLLGLPACQTAVGLFLLLLVGSDLAARMQHLASTDPLTGVLNRRGLDEAANRLIALARRGARPLSVVVADLDRFKEVNDRFGHALGDIVLKRFAHHVETTMRVGDLVGRYGGEEFVIVLPDADAMQAVEAVERLRSTLGIVIGDVAAPMPITVSFGIAAFRDRAETMASLVARADVALYRSKVDGRDRITVAEVMPSGDPRLEPVPPRQHAISPRGTRSGDARG